MKSNEQRATTHGWVARWNEGQQLCRTLLFLSSKIFTESLNKMAYMEKYFSFSLFPFDDAGLYINIDQIKLGGHRQTPGDDIMSPAPVDHHHHQHKSHRLHKCVMAQIYKTRENIQQHPRNVFIQDSYDWVIYISIINVYIIIDYMIIIIDVSRSIGYGEIVKRRR